MTSTLFSLLTFFLGLVLGNWLAVGRDKRKEFNEAVAPIRSWLLAETEAPSPFHKRPSSEEIDLFTHYLWPWQRSAFYRHLKMHRNECESSIARDGIGGVFYQNNFAIQREARMLFKYVGRR